MDGIENFLPPHWIVDYCDGGDTFLNSVTGEKTTEHPFSRYNNLLLKQRTTERAGPSEQGPSDLTSIAKEEFNEIGGSIGIPPNHERKVSNFDYHCQWSERDATGRVNNFGLTIRYVNHEKIMVKFDGIEAEWIYSALDGPSGPLEQSDLYIGAKVNVFGRHLTISSANLLAVQWIEREANRMEKRVEDYRNRILSMGMTPCVKKIHSPVVRNITRSARVKGQRDLRILRNEFSKLGEQLANLGFSNLLSN